MGNLANRPIYLDNQATTPCDPRVVAAMMPWFTERFGNPHSAEHAMGREAEDAVAAARGQVASLIGAEPREIVLTSGATESNNIAIKGAARHAARMEDRRRRVVTVATEHKCVRESVADLAAGSSRWSCRWARMGCSIPAICARRWRCRRCWSVSWA
jgi:cysteine desulfurase